MTREQEMFLTLDLTGAAADFSAFINNFDAAIALYFSRRAAPEITAAPETLEIR